MSDFGSSVSGARLGACFGLDQVPSSIRLAKSAIAVTRIQCDWGNNGLTAPIPVDDAFLLTLQLRDCASHELWIDGRAQRTGPLRRGDISIYDLRTSPVVNSISPFHNMHFYIPRAALNAMARQDGLAEVDELPNEPGLGTADLSLTGLGLSLEHAFDMPDVVASLFIDHVTSAMTVRLARAYGTGTNRAPHDTKPLSTTHERKVKEMLAAHLSGNVSMAELAEVCGMPVGEFRRAFLRRTGTTPHQWLMLQRIERACTLLHDTQLPLADVARLSAFADLRQMQRIFTVARGITPERYLASCRGRFRGKVSVAM